MELWGQRNCYPCSLGSVHVCVCVNAWAMTLQQITPICSLRDGKNNAVLHHALVTFMFVCKRMWALNVYALACFGRNLQVVVETETYHFHFFWIAFLFFFCAKTGSFPSITRMPIKSPLERFGCKPVSG